MSTETMATIKLTAIEREWIMSPPADVPPPPDLVLIGSYYPAESQVDADGNPIAERQRDWYVLGQVSDLTSGQRLYRSLTFVDHISFALRDRSAASYLSTREQGGQHHWERVYANRHSRNPLVYTSIDGRRYNIHYELERVESYERAETAQVELSEDFPVLREAIGQNGLATLSGSGYVYEYPQPDESGLQALLYNFADDAEQPENAHYKYLENRVVKDFLLSGLYTAKIYGVTDRKGLERRPESPEPSDTVRPGRPTRFRGNHPLSEARATFVGNLLQDMLDSATRPGAWTGDAIPAEIIFDGEYVAIRAGDADEQDNASMRGVFLELTRIAGISIQVKDDETGANLVDATVTVNQGSGYSKSKKTGDNGRTSFDTEWGPFDARVEKNKYEPLEYEGDGAERLHTVRLHRKWIDIDFDYELKVETFGVSDILPLPEFIKEKLEEAEKRFPITYMGARIDGHLIMRAALEPEVTRRWAITGTVHGVQARVQEDQEFIIRNTSREYQFDLVKTEAPWRAFTKPYLGFGSLLQIDEGDYCRFSIYHGRREAQTWYRRRDRAAIRRSTREQLHNGLPLIGGELHGLAASIFLTAAGELEFQEL